MISYLEVSQYKICVSLRHIWLHWIQSSAIGADDQQLSSQILSPLQLCETFLPQRSKGNKLSQQVLKYHSALAVGAAAHSRIRALLPLLPAELLHVGRSAVLWALLFIQDPWSTALTR